MDHDANPKIDIALLSGTHSPSLESPVNRLPPELLGMVFDRLRSPTKLLKPLRAWPPRNFAFAPYGPLTSAMLVCRKWHVVASERASLWTEVDCSPARRDGVGLLLTRSDAAPIHLRVDFSGSPEDKEYLRSVVRANSSRLHQLDVWANDIDSMDESFQLLGHDMPLLRGLAISNNISSSPIIVCSSVLGTFPLEGMVLRHFVYLPPPCLGPFAKLAHLYFRPPSGITLDPITTLLANAPALEVLELHCSEVLPPVALPKRMTLDRLTHLAITSMSSARVASALISSLVLPHAQTVSMVEIDFEDDLDLIPGLLPQPPLWSDIPRIYVLGGGWAPIVIRLDGGVRGLELRLNYESADWLRQVAQWPLPVPTTIPLAHVSEAHVCIDRWDLLAPFVAHYPALTTLVVETIPLGMLPEAGREMVEALRDLLLQEDPILCPGLKEVAILSLLPVPGLTEVLTPALERRARDGRRVERLRTFIRSWGQEPETAPRDVGDALAEHVRNLEVEHTDGAFWPSNERLWRKENEFWDV